MAIEARAAKILGAAICGATLLAAAGRGRADDGAEVRAAGEAAFGEVAGVLLSPRCRNCHPSGDAPLQGENHPAAHAMNVHRGSPAAGLQCAACHHLQNAPNRGGPPGAQGWAMPPAATPMVFEGKTPRELCLQLKDPVKTGGRDLAALREHMDHDPLVLWAFAPGKGRSSPPLRHEALMKSLGVWIAAGAPCPP